LLLLLLLLWSGLLLLLLLLLFLGMQDILDEADAGINHVPSTPPPCCCHQNPSSLLLLPPTQVFILWIRNDEMTPAPEGKETT